MRMLAALLLLSPASVEAQTEHQGHASSAQLEEAAPAPPLDESEVGDSPAPAPPTDHAADAVFGADKMKRARAEMAKEVGGMGYPLVMLDLLEMGFAKGQESVRFEGEASTGGNINRALLKFEGERETGRSPADIEVQALYSRAVAPYWNFQIGGRTDIKPEPDRTHLVVGVEGMAPYWIKVSAAGFLSTKGEFRARVMAAHDWRLTNALILQPRVETNISFQKVRVLGLGAGVNDVEAGLRLRYEVRQEFAPYIGFEWHQKIGGTAQLARLAGESPRTTRAVFGLRLWF